MEEKVGTQFSIYKIDDKKITEEWFKNCKDINLEEKLNFLYKQIEKTIKKKKIDKYSNKICKKSFIGMVFKTIHIPIWKDILHSLISENEENLDEFISNTHVSYLLFYICNDSIYAMTGGYGSNYISKYSVKNFGLYLLPKILKEDNNVVKHVLENNLVGTRSSTQINNRLTTTFSYEKDMSSIYRSLNVEIDREVAEKLGISFDEEEAKNKKINLITKDSLVIRRSISLDELAKILEKLHQIEKLEDNFALNYFTLASKKGKNRSTLDGELIETLRIEEYKNFILFGDDYNEDILKVYNYRILDSSNKIFLEKDIPITVPDIFEKLKKEKISLNKMKMSEILKKWTIEAEDGSGHKILYPRSLINVMQGFIEYGDDRKPYYLVGGEWYVFEEYYGDILNKEYKKLFEEKDKYSKVIKKEYNLIKNVKNENDYNEALKEENNIIVSHTVLIKKVELSDAIFWDENSLYLMHNKMKFDGTGARDLINQILIAAECIQKFKMSDGDEFLREYYTNLEKSSEKTKLPKIEDFLKLFNKKIYFLAGFLNNYRKDSQSTYAKYLLIEADKKLEMKNMGFIPLGLTI